MELHQTINELEVLATWKTAEDVVFIAKRTFSVTSPHVEYVVSRTMDGETWEHGNYFHSADYGSSEKALFAATLRFMYRAGFTSMFSRLKDIVAPWAENGVRDLGLTHSPESYMSRSSLHIELRRVLRTMEVGQVLTVAKIYEEYVRKGTGLTYVGGTGATAAALEHIVKNSHGHFAWTTDDNEARAVVRLG